MTWKESVEVGNESEEAGNDVLEFLEFGIFLWFNGARLAVETPSRWAPK